MVDQWTPLEILKTIDVIQKQAERKKRQTRNKPTTIGGEGPMGNLVIFSPSCSVDVYTYTYSVSNKLMEKCIQVAEEVRSYEMSQQCLQAAFNSDYFWS